MRRFFYNMPGMFRTAAAFLLIFSCMASASAASVRAEERMENQVLAEGSMAEPAPETEGGVNEQVKQETSEETTNIQNQESQEQKETLGTTEEAGDFGDASGSSKGEIGEKINLPDQTGGTDSDTDEEEAGEASVSGRVPIGRRVAGNYGTAYVYGGSSRMMRSAAGSDCTITPGTPHSYGNWSTTEFYVVTEKGHYMGYCAQPNKPTPAGRYQISELNHDRIKMALMFGQDGPWAGEASALFGGTANPYPYVHAMIGIEYTGETDGLTEAQIQAMRNALNEQMNSGRASMSVFREYKAYVAYNDDQDIVWLEYEGPTNGTVTLRKSSSHPGITDGNPCYSLRNAEYGIYADASCTTLSAAAVIGDSGESDAVELPEGDYWVKETAAPSGYQKDGQVYTVHVKSGESRRLDVIDTPVSDRAGLELVKRDQELADGMPINGASLAGAQFTVRYYNGFYEKGNLPQTPDRTWVLETKAVPDGAGNAVKYQALLREEYKISGDDFFVMDGIPVLPLGTITIEETKAPEGYLLEDAYIQAEGSTEKITGSFTAQIRQAGGKTALQGGNRYAVYNRAIRGGVKLRKRDLDTKAAVPQGSASLENAVFSVVNLNEYTVVVDGKACARNEAAAVIKTDETGIAQTAEDLLPYGKYRVIETGAPAGYLEKGILSREFMITKNGGIADLTDVGHSIQNRVKRGDFELRKIDSRTQKVMPDVEFSLTSTTTGESHRITTDDNGYYSSSADWNPHTRNPNQGGTEDGLWFGLDGEGGSAPVDDSLGALPYDTYILEELPTDANKGKEMLTIPLVIYKDKVTVNLGNLENKDLIENNPAISTSARNEATGNHYAQIGTVTVIDSVLYNGLKEKQEYLLKCVVMDKKNKKPVTDPEGNPVTAEQTFTAAASAGMAEVECTFDASELYGRDIVLYEELYCEEKKIAEHKDINDEGQTIHFPGIETKALDKTTGTNTVVAGEQVSIVDTITYQNLKPGQEYILRGKLVDKETGMTAKDASGAEITAERKWTPKEKDGKAEVVFTFDGSNLEGKTLVAFETLEKNNKIYAVHADIDSQEQTVYFPKVRTSARDVETNSRSAQTAEKAMIVDTVFYSNLTPGQEYTVEGTLMDQETEEPLLENGEQITGETTFTPEADSGTVDVTFELNASRLAGKTAVAFESVTKEGEEVAAHKDIHYEGQTLYFPELKTQAAEKQTGSQKITAENEITIVDKVTYQNLIPGEEYTIKGILMDRSTGAPLLLEETEIKAETTFTPEKAAGTAEVEFTFQAGSLKNKELVVFEKLYINGEVLAAHEDLNAESQTVHINKPQSPQEEQPQQPASPSEPSKSVKTGDAADILPPVLLLILSLAVLITAARKKLG